MVPHFYIKPVPAFFYPAFQLMDYGIHSWDIREGTGRELWPAQRCRGPGLCHLAFGIWAGTIQLPTDTEPFSIGVRVTTGPNAGDYRILRVAGWMA